MTNNQLNKLQLSDLSVLALACVIVQFPIYRLYISLTIAAWVFLTLVIGLIKRHTYKFNFRLIALVALFSFYALGLLWSENEKEAGFDLEVKMSLAIIPIVYMFTNYTQRQVKILIYSFFIGLLAAIIYLFFKAYLNYYCSCNFQHFFYIELSKEIHPSYLAFYMNTAIGVLVLDYIFSSIGLFNKKWVYILLIFIFALFSGFLLSRIGLLTTVLFICILYVYWFIKKKWTLFLIFASISLIGPYVIYQKSDLVKRRVDDVFNGLDSNGEEKWLQSTAIRKVVWDISTDLIARNFWRGLGTGDVQDELARQYKLRELNQLSLLNLNAHNQFLQTTLTLGIGGFLLLIIVLLQTLLKMKRMHWYNLMFSFVLCLFFLTESVLETQAGVVFIAVFYTIFNSFDFLKIKNETSDSKPVLSA